MKKLFLWLDGEEVNDWAHNVGILFLKILLSSVHPAVNKKQIVCTITYRYAAYQLQDTHITNIDYESIVLKSFLHH